MRILWSSLYDYFCFCFTSELLSRDECDGNVSNGDGAVDVPPPPPPEKENNSTFVNTQKSTASDVTNTRVFQGQF